jgi:hypothetical protein
MEQSEHDEVRRLLTNAVGDRPTEPEISFFPLVERLRAANGTKPDVTDALVVGRHYRLVTDPDNRPFGPFGPMWQMNGEAYPRPPQDLGDLREKTIDIWTVAATSATSAMVRARFCDLLWVARANRPDTWALLAVDNYLQAIDDEQWSELMRSVGGVRALEISKSLRDVRKVEEVTNNLMAFVEKILSSPDPQPGCVIPVVERLLDLESSPKALIRVLVQKVREVFRDNVFILAQVDGLSLQLLVSDDERIQISRDAALRQIGAASNAEGIAKLSHLESALANSRKFGLRDLENQIVSELRTLTKSDLGLKEISAEISISNVQFDAFIDAVVGDDSCDEALLRFGAHNPSGTQEETTQAVQEFMRDFPLLRMFPLTVVSQEGHILKRIREHSERMRYETGKYTTMRVQLFSECALEILGRLKLRYGTIVPGTLFFEESLISEDLREPIQSTFAIFEQQDFDASAHYGIHRIERIVRHIAELAGIKSVSWKSNSKGYEYLTLGRLLAELETRVNASSARYLRELLVSDVSVNLRNRIAHGLVDRVQQWEAAMLLHAICHLANYRVVQQSASQDL